MQLPAAERGRRAFASCAFSVHEGRKETWQATLMVKVLFSPPCERPTGKAPLGRQQPLLTDEFLPMVGSASEVRWGGRYAGAACQRWKSERKLRLPATPGGSEKEANLCRDPFPWNSYPRSLKPAFAGETCVASQHTGKSMHLPAYVT